MKSIHQVHISLMKHHAVCKIVALLIKVILFSKLLNRINFAMTEIDEKNLCAEEH